MDYLTARWFLVKQMPKNKLNAFHLMEKSVYNYSFDSYKLFKESKVVAPLWWQSATAFLSKENEGFWRICSNREKRLEIEEFALTVRSILRNKKIDAAELFNNIKLMHECDLLINNISLADPLPSLSCLTLPS
ncbi:hypothetical protein Emin_0570 [Elusimicrobium minutum Pei191]|uniref:Uncharacterized protein n=1 Tax=Elusimicrobium minutum (strain Pei191) TaxID=445932 RepID=B2KBZ8_ELUMP|nr:hypothetical protein [Elusimicrobium minutum]ACC98125.1 hypothetical protein Emin_0570 [Elusimicrobium minutum Pei191]